MLVLHGELGLLQDLPPSHTFPTRRTWMVKQTVQGTQGTLKASMQRSDKNAAAAALAPPAMCTTQMLPTCTQRLANGDGRPQRGSNPKSKPFRLRVTPHDIFKTLTGGQGTAETHKPTPRRHPKTREDGAGACEEGRYYDVCLATVSCLGMVLTRDGRREEGQLQKEDAECGDVDRGSKTSGTKEAMPASTDETSTRGTPRFHDNIHGLPFDGSSSPPACDWSDPFVCSY